LPGDFNDLMTELRETRNQASALAERIGRIEKRLRATLKAQI